MVFHMQCYQHEPYCDRASFRHTVLTSIRQRCQNSMLMIHHKKHSDTNITLAFHSVIKYGTIFLTVKRYSYSKKQICYELCLLKNTETHGKVCLRHQNLYFFHRHNFPIFFLPKHTFLLATEFKTGK